MATTTPPRPALEKRIKELEEAVAGLSRFNTIVAQAPAAPAVPERRSWLEKWFPGISLVAFAAFAFWLGSIHSSLSHYADRTEKVYSIILESKDSLSARTSVIESKLDAINKKLDETLAPPSTKAAQK